MRAAWLSDLFALVAYALTSAGLFPKSSSASLFTSSWFLVSAPVIAKTLSALRRRHFLDENFLILLSSVAALSVARYTEAIILVLIFRLGTALFTRVLNRVREHYQRLVRERSGEHHPISVTRHEEIETLITRALAHKGKPTQFATRFARWYTPIVVCVAFIVTITPLFSFGGESLAESAFHAAIFLVLACPTALVTSIPLTEWAALATLARRGILVTEAGILDLVSRAKTIVLVMNGIVTRGVRRISEVLPVEGMPKERLLAYAALAETESAHPIAAAIRAALGKPVPYGVAEEVLSEPGGGVVVHYEGREIAVGSAEFLRQLGVEPEPDATSGTTIHVALDRFFIGRLVVSTESHPDSHLLIRRLTRRENLRTIILSGDTPLFVSRFAREIGADEGIGGLTPQGKAAYIERLCLEQKGAVIAVGHAFDDAPLIARADIGVAAGDTPAPRALETADMVVTESSPLPIADAIATARKSRRIILQNIAFVLWIKVALVTGGIIGIAPLWLLLLADILSTLLVLLNATRLSLPPELANTRKEEYHKT